jgi:putative acetyltransferase
MRTRAEAPADHDAVHAINLEAFGGPAEARLVERLRREAKPVISLVAEEGGAIRGHILFSPVVLQGHPRLRIMGLAPMAVASGHQRKGVGSALVAAGLAECRRLEYGAVVVLGHANYYPLFGFFPASRAGISCEYEVPDEAFMLVELQAGYLRGASGKVKYHRAFADVGASARTQ